MAARSSSMQPDISTGVWPPSTGGPVLPHSEVATGDEFASLERDPSWRASWEDSMSGFFGEEQE